jgi:hypothetical protein
VNIGDIRTFDLCDDGQTNVGDKFKDQKNRIWEVVEKVPKSYTQYKCRLLSVGE